MLINIVLLFTVFSIVSFFLQIQNDGCHVIHGTPYERLFRQHFSARLSGRARC